MPLKNKDVELAKQVARTDDEIDILFDQVRKRTDILYD